MINSEKNDNLSGKQETKQKYYCASTQALIDSVDKIYEPDPKVVERLYKKKLAEKAKDKASPKKNKRR